MNIFITGAAGCIGGSVAHVLLGAGHAIRGLVRSQGKLGKLASLGITPVVGELDERELLLPEARQPDAVTRQDMAEALAFAAEGKVKADIELQPLSAINQVLERLEHGNVASRVVIDFTIG
jgi:D-arabinose 1-dehydrogenase-like Zn-dependent alcohol dehydrogenase